LLLLQCVGIGFLVYKAVDSGGVSAEPGAPAAALPSTAPVVQAAALPDEERLRQIIREELTSQLAAAPAAAAGATPAARTRDPEMVRAQRERVDEQIAHYRSVGKITEAQMNDLQRDMALLDPASRKEMLAKLMRAMNAGEIHGFM
jgi:hypothetical protein